MQNTSNFIPTLKSYKFATNSGQEERNDIYKLFKNINFSGKNLTSSTQLTTMHRRATAKFTQTENVFNFPLPVLLS
jgi:hypothetical protein